MSQYATGADMWREYKAQYGEAEARGICNRYLDMQVNTADPEELRFCKDLYAAMQGDLRAAAQPEQGGKTFEYGGYHFTPVRQFGKREITKPLANDSRPWKTDVQYAMRNMHTDRAVELPSYNYDAFFAASTDKNCDIFRCEETGRLYVPGSNELFGYNEPKQQSRAAKASVMGALEQAKQERPTPAADQKPAPGRKGGER